MSSRHRRPNHGTGPGVVDSGHGLMAGDVPASHRPTRTSLAHRAVVGFLRLSRAKQPFTGPRVEATVARRQAKRLVRSRLVAPTGWAVRGLHIERSELAGCAVWTLRPATGGSGRVVVAVHGGA